MCRNAKGYIAGERSSRGCTRADLPSVPWDIAPGRLAAHLGRHGSRDLEGQYARRWEFPPEDEDEGCPGGWSRVPFVWDLLRYYRRRDENGNRVSNPLFERCQDWLVLEAVLYIELEEERRNQHRARELERKNG